MRSSNPSCFRGGARGRSLKLSSEVWAMPQSHEAKATALACITRVGICHNVIASIEDSIVCEEQNAYGLRLRCLLSQPNTPDHPATSYEGRNVFSISYSAVQICPGVLAPVDIDILSLYSVWSRHLASRLPSCPLSPWYSSSGLIILFQAVRAEGRRWLKSCATQARKSGDCGQQSTKTQLGSCGLAHHCSAAVPRAGAEGSGWVFKRPRFSIQLPGEMPPAMEEGFSCYAVWLLGAQLLLFLGIVSIASDANSNMMLWAVSSVNNNIKVRQARMAWAAQGSWAAVLLEIRRLMSSNYYWLRLDSATTLMGQSIFVVGGPAVSDRQRPQA